MFMMISHGYFSEFLSFMKSVIQSTFYNQFSYTLKHNGTSRSALSTVLMHNQNFCSIGHLPHLTRAQKLCPQMNDLMISSLEDSPQILKKV